MSENCLVVWEGGSHTHIGIGSQKTRGPLRGQSPPSREGRTRGPRQLALPLVGQTLHVLCPGFSTPTSQRRL